jgi:hypothetical protein
MRTDFGLFGRKAVLRGNVCTIRLYASVFRDQEYDEHLWEAVSEMRPKFEEEIKHVVTQYLGREFEVQSVDFLPGSVEVLIAIGTVYYAISRYESFVKSIELLTAHLRGLLARLLGRVGPRPIIVSGTWLPGASLARAEETAYRSESIDTPSLLLLYLVVSHGALLAVLAWMLVTRLR